MAECSEIEAGGEVRKIKDVTARKPLVYSTDETDTGKKWIDGKPIYRKVYSITLTTPTPTNTLAISLDNTLNKSNAKLISYGGYLEPGTSGDSYTKGIPYIYKLDSGTLVVTSCGLTASELNFFYVAINPGNTGYIWVEYIKTTN